MMYKTGLIRILFNFEAKSKKDLFLHYYNIGKLISVASKVKDHLYVQLINYNNPNFISPNGNNINSGNNSNNITNNNIKEKSRKLYNDLFFSSGDLEKKVKIEHLDDPLSPSTIVQSNIEPLKILENLFFNYYQILYNENPKLNVSIIPLELLSGVKKQCQLKYIKDQSIDVLFLDDSTLSSDDQLSELKFVLSECDGLKIDKTDIDSIDLEFKYPNSFYQHSMIGNDIVKLTPCFNGVVLGGTFDRMHPGHKVMLTMASLLCREYMEVGITDNSILTSKKYHELIAPYQDRSDKTKRFLNTINPTVNYNMLKLLEPYANTMTSSALQCIVISPEVYNTAIKINTARRNTNVLKPLEIYSISYFDTLHQGNDIKLSSSYLRELDYNEMMKNKSNTTNTSTTTN